MLNKKWIAAGLAALMLMMQAAPVFADPATAQAQIVDLETKKTELLGEIDSLSVQLITSMAEIEDLKVQIDDKGEEIEDTTSDLNGAEKVRQTEYDAMKKRIQYLYEKGGDASWLETLLNSDDLSNLLTQAEYTEKLYKYDRDCLMEYAQTIDRIAALKSQQEEEKTSLENLKSAQETNQANLTALLDQAKAQYTDYDAQLAVAIQKAAEYQALVVQQEALYQELATAQADAIASGDTEAAEAYAAQLYSAGGGSGSYSGGSQGGSYSGGSSSGSGSSGRTYSTGGGSSIGSSIASYGLQFLGNSYVYGGNSLTNGIDCSGFVNQLYAAYGYSVPRSSSQLAQSGSSVSGLDQAEAGDVICYDGHVGIYLGDGTIVHASNEKDGIKVSDVNASGDIVAIKRYY